MKATALIQRIQLLVEDHGDLDVAYDCESELENIELVRFLKGERGEPDRILLEGTAA